MASRRNNYAQFLGMCNKSQEPKLHCTSAFSWGISTHQFPNSSSSDLPAGNSQDQDDYLASTLKTVHAGRTFLGKVDWGPKSAELQHCALAHNHLPTACRPERTFVAQYAWNSSIWAVIHFPQCPLHPHHETVRTDSKSSSLPCYSLVFPSLIR